MNPPALEQGLLGIAAHVEAAKAMMHSGDKNNTRKALYIVIECLQLLVAYWIRREQREPSP